MFEKIKGFLGYRGKEPETASSDIPETIYVQGREYRETDWSRIKHTPRKEIVAGALDAIKKFGLIRDSNSHTEYSEKYGRFVLIDDDTGRIVD